VVVLVVMVMVDCGVVMVVMMTCGKRKQ